MFADDADLFYTQKKYALMNIQALTNINLTNINESLNVKKLSTIFPKKPTIFLFGYQIYLLTIKR